MSCRSQISWGWGVGRGATGIVEWFHPCQTHSLGLRLSLICTREWKGWNACVYTFSLVSICTLVLPSDPYLCPGPPSSPWSPISTHLPSTSLVQDYSLSPIASLGSSVMGLLTLYIPSQKSREPLTFIVGISAPIAGGLRDGGREY